MLNNSMSLITELAEEVKRLRMENTRVAATLMRKEKVQDHEVGMMMGIRREEAVKEGQEKKEQMYVDRIKCMEANLKQVLTRSKAEQERRMVVETQLLAQTEAVKKFFSKEPYPSLGPLGQRAEHSGSSYILSGESLSVCL